MSTTVYAPPLRAVLPARSSSLTYWLTHGSILAADLAAFMAAGTLAVCLRYLFHAEFTPGDWLSFLPSVVVFFVVFALAGLYPGLAVNPIEEFRRIMRSSTIVFLLIIGTTFFLRNGLLLSSRLVFVLAWLFTMVLVPLSRRLVRGWCANQPWWGIPAVILGEREAGLMMFDMLAGHRRIGLRPVALLLDGEENSPAPPAAERVVCGDLQAAAALAEYFPGAYAVVAMPRTRSERLRTVLSTHAGNFRRVLLIPDLFGMTSLAVSAKDICGILTLEVEQKLAGKLPRLAKRLADVAASGLVLLAISPVLLLVTLAVRLSSPGPIFYGQRRIGRDGEVFKVWKFRSMVLDADAVLEAHLESDPALRLEWELDQKLRRDPRVTAVGRILRRTSLDELPQFWNVLCGEMSLVGPRPIVHSEIEKYGGVYDQYRRVVPGITGLWQISGRNNTSYTDRLRMDDYYVRNWSMSLDLYILLRTVKTVFLTEGAY